MSRFTLVPAAYVALLRPGADGLEVVLQLRHHTGFMDGYWALVAGHVESGESAYAAAAREAWEEVGVKIDVDDLEPLCALHRTDGTDDPIEQRIDCFFRAWRWAGEPTIMEPAKAADLRWFAMSDLPEPVVPHERVVLEHLSRGDLPPVLTFGF